MIEIIAKEAFFGSINTLWAMAKVVIPLMILLQLLRDYKILEWLTKKMLPASKVLGISKDAMLPLIIGFFIGISYGAGAVKETAEEANLSKKDIFLIGIFLSSCHGFIETTLIFAAIGANIWILTVGRILIAVILTIIMSKVVKFKDTDQLAS